MTNHNTDLGLAILMAQDDASHSEPIAVVATLDEAHNSAIEDFAARIDQIERGEFTLCPSTYSVWTRNEHGYYRMVYEFDIAGYVQEQLQDVGGN